MQITIEGVMYDLPSSLMDITLQERIDYDATYGKALSERLTKIIDIKDDFLKGLELTDYTYQSACRTLAFFAKIPLEIIEQTDLNQVMIVYDKFLKFLSEDTDFLNKEFRIQHEFEWQGDTWVIAPPELNSNSAMDFGEFLDAKQAVKDLYELGQEKWNALLSLCCVYFRKKGEVYDAALNADDSPRRQLLKTLPLEYAMHVGFFLSASMTSWLQTFLSSNQNSEEKQSQSLEDISSSGSG